MFRLVPACASVLFAASLTGAAFGADYGVPASDTCCFDEYSYQNPLEFELGLRYGYTWGQHRMTDAGGNAYGSDDNSHIIEGHFRIDDSSTNSYLRGTYGHSFIINNSYFTPGTGGTTTSSSGTIAYGIADFGMMPLDLGFAKAGAFIGYQYLHDNPDMGRVNFRTASGGFDSQVNQVDIHAIRLGTVGRVEFENFELNAQAALIPFAAISGTYGAYTVSNFALGGNTYEQGSYGTLSGSLWGASGEVMLGYSPTDNIKITAGARGYYLTGTPTLEYTARRTTNPNSEVNVIQTLSNYSLYRFGPVAGISVTF